MTHADDRTDPIRQLDVTLPSGVVHVHDRGAIGAPVIFCIHGLSANLQGFAMVVPPLLEAGFRVVALDLRGRGSSPHTGEGSYGLPAHAADVQSLAGQLGADRFSIIGWSLGALIGMQCAVDFPDQVDRLVMIDHADREDDATVALIERGLARLDTTFPNADTYVSAIREAGAATPWADIWDRFYRYELGPVEGGVKPRTSRAAAIEDLSYLDRHDLSQELWPKLRLPVLLVRANVPLGGGLIVPAEERDAFLAAVDTLQVVEVEANHYGVMAHPTTISSIRRFLSATD